MVIDNALVGMQSKQDVCKQNLAEQEKQFETAKVECKREFPQEAELEEKSARLATLDSLLNMDKKENVLIDGEIEEQDVTEEKKIRKEHEMAR